MSSIVLPCLGLATDAHSLAAPKGSMRIADNVVCDLPGSVRARPNFELGTNKSTTYMPVAMHVYGSTRIVVSRTAAGAYRLESEAATITGNADPVSFDTRETSFAEARKSLYYCTSTGVRVLRTEAGTTTDEAGLFPLLSPGGQTFALSADAGPHDSPYAFAYVLIVKRTDANGYVRRSPPSLRFYARDESGSTNRAIDIAVGATSTKRIAFASGTIVAGDEVEIYRSLKAADPQGTPAASVYLVTTYTITSADVTSGYFPPSGTTLQDKLEDAQLGEAAYSNPEREGALNAKYPPPIARELALWSSCMWFGRTKGPHRLVLEILYVGQDNATVLRQDNPPTVGELGFRHFEGVTSVAITGDLASGTNTILNVTDVTGVAVGDYVSQSPDTPFLTAATGGIPSGTQITQIAGAGPYTVTMSANATATTVGAVVYFMAKITVDGQPYAGANQTPLGLSGDRQTFKVSIFDTNAERAADTAEKLVRVINDRTVGSGGTVRAYQTTAGQIVIERTSPSGSSITVTSPHPQAFTPQIGAGLVSTQEDKPHRVYFSRPDEPEAVPLLNYIDIGSELAPIQRLVPLADALMVFKEDGLYRITGSAPDNWSVTLLDPTLRLVRPEACDVLDDVAYCWTNRGVCAVDETGVRQIISAGKIDAELFTAQGAILGEDGYHGCRVLTSQRHQLVLLTLPNTALEAPLYQSRDAYCYSAKTGAWTKWPELYVRCGDSGSDGVLWIAADNALDELEWETRYLLDTPRGYDRSYTISAWTETASSTAMSITNAQRGEWVPTVGDWVFWTIGSVYWRRIVAVVDAGSGNYSWTLDSAAPSNIASATSKGAVVGTPTLLEWLPSAMGTSGMSLSVWREIVFQMDGEAQAKVSPTDFRVTFGVRHDGAATIPTVVGTPDRSTVQLRPYRMGWPRNGSRRADAAPRLGWSEIDWPWRLTGVNLIGELGSEKVRQ